jgi:hypothetical protein
MPLADPDEADRKCFVYHDASVLPSVSRLKNMSWPEDWTRNLWGGITEKII